MAWLIRSIPAVNYHDDGYPSYDNDERRCDSMVCFQETHSLVLLWDKYRTNPIKEQSGTYLASVPQNCQGHLKQEASENFGSQEERKET